MSEIMVDDVTGLVELVNAVAEPGARRRLEGSLGAWVTTGVAAAAMGVTRRHVRRLARSGYLRAVWSGSRWWVDGEQVARVARSRPRSYRPGRGGFDWVDYASGVLPTGAPANGRGGPVVGAGYTLPLLGGMGGGDDQDQDQAHHLDSESESENRTDVL